MGAAIDAVVNSPGRSIRSAVEMSQMAPFTDRAVSGDRTNFANTFISYYTWGSVIGLGLDVTLRDRSAGRVSLDDFSARSGRSTAARALACRDMSRRPTQSTT